MGRPSTRRPTVILSSSEDAVNYRKVAALLEERGCWVVAIETDAILGGLCPFSLEMTYGRPSQLSYGESSFDPANVAAAWWRKPQWVQIQRGDRVVAISLEQELARTHTSVASLISDAVWLNSPQANWIAESKLHQLIVASRLGFEVPSTVLANRWDAIEGLAQDQGDLIYKTFRGQLETTQENRIIFTRHLDPGALLALQRTRPWPGLFQEFVPAKREWRITVVGDVVFSAAIYATGDAVVDWRKHQFSADVRFVDDRLPSAVERSCAALTAELGLRYGAIDLLERPNGRFVFLEINPNGQYGWLETELGFEISKAIAERLASIATQ